MCIPSPASLRPEFGRVASVAALLMLVATAAGQSPRDRNRPAPGPQSCANDCHLEVRNRKVMHGPAAADCQACHVLSDAAAHKFALITRSPEALCQRCHSLPHRNRMHEPVKEGMCMKCHDPHGSDRKAMLVADPQRELCTQCHSDSFKDAAFVHGPVAVGACIVCHEPHASTRPALLAEEPDRLCLKCHGEIETVVADSRHVHQAMEGGCSACHDPHASAHRFHLRDQAPGLCLTCHQEHLGPSLAQAAVVHGAVTEEGGCTACHLPHASQLPHLQRLEQPQACLTCHDREIQEVGGAVLPDMAALLRDNPNHHGPIREGACTTCHRPHAGEHFRLLVEDYPPEFYAPFALERFSLCFQCHMPDLVLKPSGRGLTNFRDGDMNLHWLHVNQEKGRTCRACHEVHASRRPAHMREAVPFGDAGWMLQINFTKTEDGGACAPACHKEKSYRHGGAKADTPPSASRRAAP